MVRDLLHKLADAGVTFSPDGCGGMRVSGPLDDVPELLTEARARRAEVLAELARQTLTAAPAIPVPAVILAGCRPQPVTDPGSKPAGALWFCAVCGWPRSTGPDPCPSCGGVAGLWLTKADLIRTEAA